MRPWATAKGNSTSHTVGSSSLARAVPGRRPGLRLRGEDGPFEVVWDDINLQDEVEEARAELYREQARKLRIANDREEKGE